MCDSEQASTCLTGEVYKRLECAPSFPVLMTVAGNGAHNGVNDQQPGTAGAGNSCLKC